MAPTRQVCHRQLQLVVEFAEANQKIVLGNFGKGPLGQLKANKAWKELASRLNCIGGGVTKTPEKWKRYWHLLKCRTKAKAAECRRSHVGGGRNRTIPLSDLEERIIAVIGKVAEEGIPEVRIPLDISTETSDLPGSSLRTPAQSAAPSSSMAMALENGAVELEGSEVLEQHEVELENYTLTEQPQHTSDLLSSCTGTLNEQLPEPSATPASSTDETLDPLAPEPRQPVGSSRATQRRSGPRRNRDENLPRWAYELEERRIAGEERRIAGEERRIAAEERRVAAEERRIAAEERRIAAEERIAEELASSGATNRAMLGCLQELIALLRGN